MIPTLAVFNYTSVSPVRYLKASSRAKIKSFLLFDLYFDFSIFDFLKFNSVSFFIDVFTICRYSIVLNPLERGWDYWLEELHEAEPVNDYVCIDIWSILVLVNRIPLLLSCLSPLSFLYPHMYLLILFPPIFFFWFLVLNSAYKDEIECYRLTEYYKLLSVIFKMPYWWIEKYDCYPQQIFK